ncbi:hypothetical protein ABPG75_007742 [Micractinium tetrahymenae]
MACGDRLFDGWTALLAAVVAAHALAAPFTKVEESFNLQAAHDLLYHGSHAVSKFDHLDFPGVVPRTFLGALAVAGAAAPLVLPLHAAGLPKLAGLLVVRLTLGALTIASLALLQRAVRRRFGPTTAAAFMLLTALQFHLPFYLSRTLPNVLAMLLTNAGLAAWMQGGSPLSPIYLLAAAAVIFRCDMLLLVGLVGLHLLASRRIGLAAGVCHGALAVAASLAASVAVDSYFWRRWLWPEGEVLYFNTVLNKSHEWGVMPAHWYFTSALPRALHAAYPLALLAPMLERRAAPLLGVALGFVGLYSGLGHKEVRFLFPVLPLWNAAAACVLQRAWDGRRKRGVARRAALAALAAALAGGAALTALTAAASACNYPGGQALRALHELGAADAAAAAAEGHALRVHIGVLPAMTGVSRFGELGPPWAYSKEEGLTKQQLAQHRFDFLLTDTPDVPGYTMAAAASGFRRLALASRSPAVLLRGLLQGQLPVRIKTEPQVYVLRRLTDAGQQLKAGSASDVAAAA